MTLTLKREPMTLTHKVTPVAPDIHLLVMQVNKLLAAGADPSLALTDLGSVPLFTAVRSEHTGVVKVKLFVQGRWCDN